MLKKDLFVLGIQTKEQLEMFKQGAQKIYSIDSTTVPTNMSFL